MSRRSLLLLCMALVGAYACYVRAEQNPYARYVAAAFSVIDRWALQDAPDEQLFDAALNGMVEVLRAHGDEHSQFVSASLKDAFREDISQEFGGVGIRVRNLGDPPVPTVVGPPEPGTPAFRGDIQSGDRLTAVDGVPTADKSLDEVTRMIRGPAGEEVVLTLLRPDAPQAHDVTIVREVITVDSILGDVRGDQGQWQYLLDQFPDIAYVRITKFGDKTAAELGEVLGQLTEKDPQGLILDLRDNYGGALDAAVEIADMFLPPGLPIVTTRGRDKRVRDRFVSTGSGVFLELPLAILLNQNSASASEIVAGCLQDYQRAVVVGQRSYGKGTVQRLMRLESGRSLLKITSATYWRPSERNIHRMPGDGLEAQWGVSPDPGLELPLDEQEYLNWRRYRARRDLFGNRENPDLVEQLDAQDGPLPPDFRDQGLELAAEFLQKLEKAPKNVQPSRRAG